MIPQPYQVRAIDERNDLVGKITRLVAFMETDLFRGLPTAEQDRMRRQLGYMRDYHSVLAERIAAF